MPSGARAARFLVDIDSDFNCLRSREQTDPSIFRRGRGSASRAATGASDLGADLYLLASIFHDWDDARAVQILRICRRAIPDHARLLLIEMVVPPGDTSSFTKFLGTSPCSSASVAANAGKPNTAPCLRRPASKPYASRPRVRRARHRSASIQGGGPHARNAVTNRRGMGSVPRLEQPPRLLR